MIDAHYLEEIGLTSEQIEELLRARSRERRLRSALLREGFAVGAVEGILADIPLKDAGSEELILEKIRTEYHDLIVPTHHKRMI